MKRSDIPINVQRKLFAESMGRCMNPECQIDLIYDNGDIMEKAHIEPYCETADNSFENLVIFCPNCHTIYDKLSKTKPEEILYWKHKRQDDIEKFFSKNFESFENLKNSIVPLLLENKEIYENYFLTNNKILWDKFELKLLSNNRKIKTLLQKNLDLIQDSKKKDQSNLSLVITFIEHIDEFEATRLDKEKTRQILFPQGINSLFGIEAVKDSLITSLDSLENLLKKLIAQNNFIDICLGDDDPYITILESGHESQIFLKDSPRVRQLYSDYKSFRPKKFDLKSLNLALIDIHNKRIHYDFKDLPSLRTITINNVKIYFVYEYCLSKEFLFEMQTEENSLIVNLYRWNSNSCISQNAYDYADTINVKLLTIEEFKIYVKKLKTNS